MSRTLPGYEILQSTILPVGAVNLLESTEFGSDGLRYRRLKVQQQLERFYRPRFFYIQSEQASVQSELVGLYVIDERRLLINGQEKPGYYRAALVVAKTWQGQGLGKALTQSAMQWIDQQSSQQPSFTYGCIDASNRRSLAVLASQGVHPVAHLRRLMMYRQWLRQPVELAAVYDDGSDTHSSQGFSVSDITHSSLQGFTLADKQGSIISARCAETAFCITDMGVMVNGMVRCFVTPWPPARKRFDPQNFRTISFSQVVIRQGGEANWSDFVSSVLSHYRCHFGAIYLDKHDPLLARLQNTQGLMQRLFKSTDSVCVVARYSGAENFSASGEVLSRPVNLWPVDA